MSRANRMKKITALLTGLLATVPLWATDPGYDSGGIGLGLALRKLPLTARFLQITAHPDDEDNSLLVLLSRGRGIRTGLLTLTRGDGGQNEIGPELFEALGVIRTEELMTMHQFDGADQFFTRAYEFGYSFSVEETLQKWGREEILRDMVAIIRSYRPDVITCMPRTGRGGGQHHQASAILAVEAFHAAADPTRFPEQIAEGYLPWQAKKLYERARWGESTDTGEEEAGVRVHTGTFDPLLGATYAQVGLRARAAHRCQGMGQLVPLPGPAGSDWRLIESMVPVSLPESDLFDGVETGLLSMEPLFPPGEREQAREALLALEADAKAAQESYRLLHPGQTLPHLTAGLSRVRDLKSWMAGLALDRAARAHLGFLLEGKEADFENAIRLASGFQVEALAEDGLVVAGQEVGVLLSVSNTGASAMTVDQIETLPGTDLRVVTGDLSGFGLQPGETLKRQVRLKLGDAPHLSRPFWRRSDPSVDRFEVDSRFAGLPWSAPALSFRFSYSLSDVAVSTTRVVEFRYEGPWRGGEQRHDLMVVPLVSLTPESKTSILPVEAAGRGHEIRLQVAFYGRDPLEGTVRLDLPAGWRSEPKEQPYRFEREGEKRVSRFRLFPPTDVSSGSFRIGISGRFAEHQLSEAVRLIDYDHIRLRPFFEESALLIEVLPVRVASALKVAFIVGVGDEVPTALSQLGIDYDLLKPEDLAFGDLDRYEVIITGVRAYLVRDDLKTYHSRLLEWVERGGTLIVQYNKFEFNGGAAVSPYAPFPARVGRGRVTEEAAPVRILQPAHPVFNSPNLIGGNDWAGWVQERGLYFLGEKSESYADLVSTSDPFEYNSGEKLGSLVEARYGKGRWIYVGLGLWRQLPAGVPGAYRLLANLLSLPRASQ